MGLHTLLNPQQPRLTPPLLPGAPDALGWVWEDAAPDAGRRSGRREGKPDAGDDGGLAEILRRKNEGPVSSLGLRDRLGGGAGPGGRAGPGRRGGATGASRAQSALLQTGE